MSIMRIKLAGRGVGKATRTEDSRNRCTNL